MQDIAHEPDAMFARDVRYVVDRLIYFRVGILRRQLRCTLHDQTPQSAQSACRTAGMDGGQRPAMTGVHRIEQCASLDATNFAEYDAVGMMAECGFQQVVEGDLVPVGIGLRFLCDQMRLAEVKLCCVFNDQNAFF